MLQFMKPALAFLVPFLVTNALYGADEGFVPLFNGRDLDGWVNVNCAPETWSVRDGLIHCTGHPTGALRTTRQYENFILQADWRHLSSGGNSGVFIWGTPIAAPGVPFLRGIEVQVLDHGYDVKGKNEWYTTHGDVFPIHGASMKPFGRHNGMRSFPSEERSKPSPEWNQYQIVCSNGVIRLSVNGKEVSGGEECNYRKGYLALESEGAPVEFRNIRIKELPGSGASAELTAPLDQGWHSLLTGLDLRGWQTNASAQASWQVRDGRLIPQPGKATADATLWTAKTFGAVEFILDCKPAKASDGAQQTLPVIKLGNSSKATEVPLSQAVPGKYQRFTITVRRGEISVASEGQTERVQMAEGTPSQLSLGLASGAAEFMNIFAREL